MNEKGFDPLWGVVIASGLLLFVMIYTFVQSQPVANLPVAQTTDSNLANRCATFFSLKMTGFRADANALPFGVTMTAVGDTRFTPQECCFFATVNVDRNVLQNRDENKADALASKYRFGSCIG